MKKISILLCVFLLGTVGSTVFGGTVGVPVAKVKVVHPRVVQRGVVAPTCGCEPVAVGVPCACVKCVKVVQPRVVQRSVVMSDCVCESMVDVDPTRIARVTTLFPRTVQRGVVVPTCGCEPSVDTGTPRLARVKVVQPRVVQRGVVVPACGCLYESQNVMP